MKAIKQVLIIGLSLGAILGAATYLFLNHVGQELEQDLGCATKPCISETVSFTTAEPVDIQKALDSGGLVIK